jgi:hypothetical protein
MAMPRESLRLPLLAGWLFADLMLLLFVVSLNPAPTESTAGVARATPSPTASPTATVTPPFVPRQRVLDHKYYEFTVNVALPGLQLGNTARQPDRQLINRTNAQIRTLVARHPALQGKEVGVAVIFGAGPIGAISTATAQARTAGRVLHAADAKFRQASFLPLWTENTSPSFVRLIVFFYAT